MIAILVAYSANRVIGRDGDLPWHLPSDLQRFKALTVGHTVLMGRRTFESLPPRFRPLPNRRNWVLTRGGTISAPGVEMFGDLQAPLQTNGEDTLFVIGGASVYAEALPLADRVLATEIDGEVAGDTFFPDLPAGWRATETSERLSEGGHTFRFVTYERS